MAQPYQLIVGIIPINNKSYGLFIECVFFMRHHTKYFNITANILQQRYIVSANIPPAPQKKGG